MVFLSMVALLRAAAGAATSCVHSEEFFVRHNISADESEEPGADFNKQFVFIRMKV